MMKIEIMACLLLAGHLHVTDFGLAKRLKIGQRTTTICGTLQYIGNSITLLITRRMLITGVY